MGIPSGDSTCQGPRPARAWAGGRVKGKAGSRSEGAAQTGGGALTLRQRREEGSCKRARVSPQVPEAEDRAPSPAPAPPSRPLGPAEPRTWGSTDSLSLRLLGDDQLPQEFVV